MIIHRIEHFTLQIGGSSSLIQQSYIITKEYDKYLKRIEQIVHKKPHQGMSPMKDIKAQRQYKESVHKLARQELDH